MNQNQKALVDALRSGEYEQGSRLLRPRANQFCCLGVGCDISNLGEWEQRGEGANSRYYVVDDMASDFRFPLAVAYYFDFEPSEQLLLHPDFDVNRYNRNDPFILVQSRKINYDKIMTCSQANDDGYTFSEIADAIEYTYG